MNRRQFLKNSAGLFVGSAAIVSSVNIMDVFTPKHNGALIVNPEFKTDTSWTVEGDIETKLSCHYFDSVNRIIRTSMTVRGGANLGVGDTVKVEGRHMTIHEVKRNWGWSEQSQMYTRVRKYINPEFLNNYGA